MRTFLPAATAFAVVLSLGVAVPAAAATDPPPTETNGGSLVEDFAYPGADVILAQQNVHLISGDGHIMLADCATPPVANVGVMKVWTTEAVGPGGGGLVCFKVTAARGWLNLEVPGVYEIRGDGQRTGTGHAVTAEVTTDDGEHTTVAVNPSGSTQVGIGADPDNEPTTLLRLSADGAPAPLTVVADYGFVARVEAGDRACSGTVVAPQWVLTAASCFGSGAQEPRAVAIGANRVPIAKLVPYSGRDVVLARLRTKLPGAATILPGGDAPAAGQVFQAAGFGRTATEWVPSAPHLTQQTASAVSGGEVVLAGSQCKGDAGGPLLRRDGTGWDFVAIHHTAYNKGCFDSAETRQGAVETRVDDLGPWVRETLRKAPENVRVFYEYPGALTRMWQFDDLAADATAPDTLWDSGAGEWDAARGKTVTGDFDGDGVPDTAVFYNGPDNKVTLYVFDGATDEPEPREAWNSGTAGWDWSRTGFVAGDYNGDGLADIGAFVGLAGEQVKLSVFENVDGPATVRQLWDSGAGNWDWTKATFLAGDFDGDGKAEFGAFYNYGNKHTKWWYFDDQTGSLVPRMVWDFGDDNWDLARSKWVVGDFDGDGTDDIGGFYNYDNKQTKLWVFEHLDGEFADHLAWDGGVNNWDWNRAKYVAGDFDADGRTEIGGFYDYGNAQTKLWIFQDPSDDFQDHMVWDSGRGNWIWSLIRPASGA